MFRSPFHKTNRNPSPCCIVLAKVPANSSICKLLLSPKEIPGAKNISRNKFGNFITSKLQQQFPVGSNSVILTPGSFYCRDLFWMKQGKKYPTNWCGNSFGNCGPGNYSRKMVWEIYWAILSDTIVHLQKNLAKVTILGPAFLAKS